MARQRSQIYGLLATLYRQELTPDLLKRIKDSPFLEVLSRLGIDWAEELLTRPDHELLDELAIEYARLFLGPGRHISPHESVHHHREDGKWGQLWGQSTVEVKKFIEAAGFHYESEYKGLPDHISVVLEFMHKVIEREEQAWIDNEPGHARYCQKIGKRFMEEHLAQWINGFCDTVTQEAELSFYRDVATLTKNFIEFDRKDDQ